MNQDKNEAAQEFMEEIVDDLGYTPKGVKNQGSRSSLDQRQTPKYLIPGGIITVLFVAVIAFFVMGRDGDHTEALASIQARLDRLEERMDHLNRLEERITHLEGLKGLKGLAGLENRIIRLEKEGKGLQQEIQKAAAHEKTSAPKKAVPEVKQRYHTVKSGESLYAIAAKYGISTDRLCRLNKITPNKPIHPGQKLLVGE